MNKTLLSNLECNIDFRNIEKKLGRKFKLAVNLLKRLLKKDPE